MHLSSVKSFLTVLSCLLLTFSVNGVVIKKRGIEESEGKPKFKCFQCDDDVENCNLPGRLPTSCGSKASACMTEIIYTKNDDSAVVSYRQSCADSNACPKSRTNIMCTGFYDGRMVCRKCCFMENCNDPKDKSELLKGIKERMDSSEWVEPKQYQDLSNSEDNYADTYTTASGNEPYYEKSDSTKISDNSYSSERQKVSTEQTGYDYKKTNAVNNKPNMLATPPDDHNGGGIISTFETGEIKAVKSEKRNKNSALSYAKSHNFYIFALALSVGSAWVIS